MLKCKQIIFHFIFKYLNACLTITAFNHSVLVCKKIKSLLHNCIMSLYYIDNCDF